VPLRERTPSHQSTAGTQQLVVSSHVQLLLHVVRPETLHVTGEDWQHPDCGLQKDPVAQGFASSHWFAPFPHVAYWIPKSIE
jgi:hypothetical protein